MTARTVAYLKANEFTLSGTPGRITPQFMQDTLDSVLPWDVISGNAAPYVYQKVLNGNAYFQAQGGVIGAGQSGGQRTTNGTALQATFTYAVTNTLTIFGLEGIIEIDLAGGVLIPGGAYGFGFVGSPMNTNIVQFSVSGTGSPVLTIGDPAGVSDIHGLVFSGIKLSYGVDVTGKTTAQALVLGFLINCRVTDINVVGNFSAYDGILLQSGGSGTFSNNFTNIFIWGVQRHFINYNSITTGDSWDNVYCNNGGYTPSALSGSYLSFNVGAANVKFSRTNFEWGICNHMVDMNSVSVNGLYFDAFHCEGITLTGTDPAFFAATNSTFQVDSGSIVTPTLLTANLTGGNYALVLDYSDTAIGITALFNNLTLQINTVSTVNSPLFMYRAGANAMSNDQSNIVINGFWAYDGSGGANQWTADLTFDSHLVLNAAGRTINRFERYAWGPMGSKIDKLVMTVTSTYTHYGQLRDATLIVPASITGFTITLGVVQGATGNQPVNPGNTVRIRRLGAGVNTGTLALSGATLGSVCNNGQAADFTGIFGGVAPATPTATWGALTPVS